MAFLAINAKGGHSHAPFPDQIDRVGRLAFQEEGFILGIGACSGASGHIAPVKRQVGEPRRDQLPRAAVKAGDAGRWVSVRGREGSHGPQSLAAAPRG